MRRAPHAVVAATLLVVALAGCAPGAFAPEAGGGSPGRASPPAATVAPTASETTGPEASTEPTPEQATSPAPAANPWVAYAAPDGTLAFEHPRDWSVLDRSAPMSGTLVTLVTPDGYEAFDVQVVADSPQWPRSSPCDDPTYEPYAWHLLDRAPIDPLAGPLAGAAPAPLELVTFTLDGDLIALAVLRADHVDAGCLDGDILVQGGMVRAGTPFGTDATGLIYERFDDAYEFLSSSEHDVLLEVLASLEVVGVG